MVQGGELIMGNSGYIRTNFVVMVALLALKGIRVNCDRVLHKDGAILRNPDILKDKILYRGCKS